MIISEIIKELEALKELHGDLIVCISEPHDYWGSIHKNIHKHSFLVSKHMQPEGPKSGKCEIGILID